MEVYSLASFLKIVDSCWRDKKWAAKIQEDRKQAAYI